MTNTHSAPNALISERSPLRKQLTFAVIVGNRGFFPDHLAKSGREKMLEVLAKAKIKTIIVGTEDTKYGAVETLQEARACADLFRVHRDEIDGVIVTLPNFGDERAIANTLRFADLHVPVLMHAFPDDAQKMTIENRRDSFCGKMSACNNLHQYGIHYTLTTRHTMDPESPEFLADLKNFAAVCRVVRGIRNARIGALGARPAAFNTVRYSEKLLEQAGVSVETLDLSEVYGRVSALQDDDATVAAKAAAIKQYANTAGVPELSIIKMAKFGVVLDNWVTETQLDATAIQCWTSMEEFFGVVPCTLMSMASNSLLPSACETDVAGALAMYALELASGQPGVLLDWNNNYGDDPDKGVVFHCSNLPKDVFVDEIPRMNYQEIIAGTVGKANTYGALYGRIKEAPFTFLRISTDEFTGKMAAYTGEGVFTKDSIDTFGGYGVVRVPHFQKLLEYICENGFEHHVAVTQKNVSAAMYEALTKYLGWSVYNHQ